MSTIDGEPLRSMLGGVAGALGSQQLLVPHLASGKLLRGRLVMAVAAIGGASHDEGALRAASQIELIHAGALIHDDIMDGSIRRRRRASLWAEIGVRPAMFAGLGLMAQAAADMAPAPGPLRREVADLIHEVARGQTDELAHAFSTSLSPERYLRRAQAKTGTLYELAARLGAAAGHLDPRTTDAVAQFAALLGLGFQLADDVRDLLGDPVPGRPPGTDLRVGVYTLPVLTTLAGRFPGGERLRALLEKNEPAALDDCVALVCGNGAVDSTVKRARTFVYEAVACLAAVSSLRARVVLEAYACELLGPLRTTGERLALWADDTSPPTGRGRLVPRAADPPLQVALHPEIPWRVRDLLRPLAGHVALRRAVGAAVTVVLVADEAGGSAADEPLDPGVRAERASLVGAVDLLFADLWAELAALPGPVAAVVARRLAGMLLQHAQGGRSAHARAFGDDEPLRSFVEGVARETARTC